MNKVVIQLQVVKSATPAQIYAAALVVIYNIRLYNFPSDVSLAIIVEFYLVIGRERYEIEQSTWRQQHDNGYRFETDFQTPAGNDWVTERLMG
jgi:hypothetical protein